MSLSSSGISHRCNSLTLVVTKEMQYIGGAKHQTSWQLNHELKVESFDFSVFQRSYHLDDMMNNATYFF
jgi:hypothetical protein